jgi:hypothetical protein
MDSPNIMNALVWDGGTWYKIEEKIDLAQAVFDLYKIL